METAIYESAMSTYGVKHWVREYADHLLPLYEINKKKKKKKKKKPIRKNPSRESKDYIRTAKSILQGEERRCGNEYWLNLCKAM